MTRIPLVLALLLVLASAAVFSNATVAAAEPPNRPNVILVMADDQGYGDLGCHGNPVLATPHLDRLYRESVRLTDFHVAPMCTPTRGQLLTGIDALRNGAMNVSSGRTLLRPELPTLADLLAAAGYRTGLFGKWHLGDNYPFRPQDRGFHTSLWFPSSHIGSVPDFWDNDYFDDTFLRDGRRERLSGYCTDVFFAEGIRWMQSQAAEHKPFLAYLPLNAPHSPHFVPASYRAAAATAFDRARPTLPALPAGQQQELIRFLAMTRTSTTTLAGSTRFSATAACGTAACNAASGTASRATRRAGLDWVTAAILAHNGRFSLRGQDAWVAKATDGRGGVRGDGIRGAAQSQIIRD